MESDSDKLEVVVAMITEAMDRDVLCSTRELFEDILFITGTPEEKSENKLTVSVDYTIKDNSTFSAWTIESPEGNPITSYLPLPSKNEDEAALDAIYMVLDSLRLNPNLSYSTMKIDIYVPNNKIVKLLNSKIGCLDEKISHKKDSVLETVESLGHQVYFGWRPSNSTKAMKMAKERLPYA